jgi:alkyldihydroxyacetonephosphate synthase
VTEKKKRIFFMESTHENQSWHELEAIVGHANVLADAESLALHSYDVWPVAAKWKGQGKLPYRPQVVVRPASAQQVSQVLRWASQQHIPVTPWGLGSSVTGAPLALKGGISLDMSGMNRILALDENNLLVKVQAGKLGSQLEQELNQRGYTLNHSPQSLDRSTVGGWVSTRATGQFSSRWGGIEDLALALTVALPGGEIVETLLAPRGAVGPDLRQVFIGAEGTLGVVVDATLKIFPLPERRIFQTLAFGNVAAGLEAMRAMMQAGLRPFLLRFYDPDEAPHALQNPHFAGCAMFLGCEGLAGVAQAEYQACLDLCSAHGGQTLGPDPALAWMERRFDFSTVENLLAQPGGLAETIEVAHFWDGILDTYHALKTGLAPYAGEVLGHFSHAYPQGTSLYVILLGKATDDAQAEARLLQVWQTAMQIALEKGAVISHHHGVGIARLAYMRPQLGSAMQVLERIKQALDPTGIMNPGKLGLN